MNNEERIIRRRLGDERIQRVFVVHGVNQDGAAVRRVYVIYDQSKGDLTTKEMSDTIDALWSDSLGEGLESAPVTSFISSEDAEGAYAAQ